MIHFLSVQSREAALVDGRGFRELEQRSFTSISSNGLAGQHSARGIGVAEGVPGCSKHAFGGNPSQSPPHHTISAKNCAGCPVAMEAGFGCT